MGATAFCHPDPEALEQAFLRRLAELRRDRPLAPAWIVTPTHRLRRRLQTLLSRDGAQLGLLFLDLRGLAEQLERRLGLGAAPPLLSPTAAQVLLRQAMAADAQGREMLRYAGGAAALLPALLQLREALGPQAAPADPAAPLLLRLLPAWRRRVAEQGHADEVDGPDRISAALAGAGSLGLPPLFLFGFSELVPRWTRLLRALARSHSWTLYLHAAEPSDQDFAAAQRLLERLSLRAAKLPEAAPPRPRLLAARSLRGPRAEIEEAFYQIRAWHLQEGVALEDLAVVARSFEPYLPYLEPALRRLGFAESDAAGSLLLLDSVAAVPAARYRGSRALLAAAEGGPGAARAFWSSAAAVQAPEWLAQGWKRAWQDAAQAAEMGRGEVPFPTLLGEALRRARLRPYERPDGSGLAFLDFQQARGLRFSGAVLLGLHEGSCPRPAQEDPFLAAAAADPRLRGLEDPPPSLPDQRAEERLLLQLALRVPRDQVVLLRQHSGADGESLAESPLQGAIERFFGRDALVYAAQSGHPLHAAARRRAAGAATPEEAVLAAAERGPVPEAAAELAADPACGALLGPAAAWLPVVEDPRGSDLRFDGRVPPDPGLSFLEKLSATGFESYGRSPLRYFFERLLGVEPPPQTGLPLPDPRALGSAVHALLEAWNRSPAAGLAAADQEFERLIAPLFAGGEAHAGLLEFERERWRSAIRRFLRWDSAQRQAAAANGGEEFEVAVDGPIELDGGLHLSVSGKVDRLLRSGTGGRLTDYKTGKVKDVASKTRWLRGTELQLPLYLLLLECGREDAAGEWSAEALRVSPECDYEAKPGAGGYQAAVSAGDWRKIRAGVRETIQVLAEHLRLGCFPAARDEQFRGWDPYFATGRVGHFATRLRLRRAGAYAALFELSRKVAGRRKDGGDSLLTLEAVRARRGELDQEEEE